MKLFNVPALITSLTSDCGPGGLAGLHASWLKSACDLAERLSHPNTIKGEAVVATAPVPSRVTIQLHVSKQAHMPAVWVTGQASKKGNLAVVCHTGSLQHQDIIRMLLE